MTKTHLHHAIALNRAEREIYLEVTGKMKNVLPGREMRVLGKLVGSKYTRGLEEMCIFARLMLRSYENLEESSKDEKDEKLLGNLTFITDTILRGPTEPVKKQKK